MSKRFPLEGIKIADFEWVAAGPFSTSYLADYGAEVIRIESSKNPDQSRGFVIKDGKLDLNSSRNFGMLNANKRSFQVNMKHPNVMEVLRPIIEWADVVAENFRPGVMEKWGLDYEGLKAINPSIIMVRSSINGHSGPRGKIGGFGLHNNALTGFIEATGWPDRVGVPPHSAITDCVAPVTQAQAIIAAMMYKKRTGKGMYIDVSHMEASLDFMTVPILDYQVNGRILQRHGNWEPDLAPYNIYECDGKDRWCAVTVTNEEEWKAFCGVIGDPEWTKDPKFADMASRKANEAELDALITEWSKTQEARSIMNRMQAAGVPAGVVANGQDIMEDPQYVERKFFQSCISCGHENCIRFIPAYRLSSVDYDILHEPAPCIGEANEYVCKEIVGMDDARYEELKADELFV